MFQLNSKKNNKHKVEKKVCEFCGRLVGTYPNGRLYPHDIPKSYADKNGWSVQHCIGIKLVDGKLPPELDGAQLFHEGQPVEWSGVKIE